MTNKEETDVTESQIVRASVLESHGWSSEQNRSQCKFRNKFSCFFVILIFSFRSSLLLFILRDIFGDPARIVKSVCSETKRHSSSTEDHPQQRSNYHEPSEVTKEGKLDSFVRYRERKSTFGGQATHLRPKTARTV